MNKIQHEKWLFARGLHPKQIAIKKKSFPNKYLPTDLTFTRPEGKISENGTVSPDISKAEFSKKNFTIAPAYPKGAYTVVPKTDIQYSSKKI